MLGYEEGRDGDSSGWGYRCLATNITPQDVRINPRPALGTHLRTWCETGEEYGTKAVHATVTFIPRDVFHAKVPATLPPANNVERWDNVMENLPSFLNIDSPEFREYWDNVMEKHKQAFHESPDAELSFWQRWFCS